MPLTSIIVPSVTKIGWTRSHATIAPLKNPTRSDMPNPASKARVMTPVSSNGELSGPSSRVRIAAMTSPQRLVVATIARFSPPLMSGIIIARVSRPSSGNWNAMERQVSREKNRSGASPPKIATASTIKPANNPARGLRGAGVVTGNRGPGLPSASEVDSGGTMSSSFAWQAALRDSHAQQNHEARDRAERV